MNQEETRAETLFKEALLTSIGAFTNETLSDQDKAGRIQQAIHLCQQALGLGLPKRQKIKCHQELGLMLFYTARDPGTPERLASEDEKTIPERLASEDVKTISTVNDAFSQLELALELDAQTGERVFADRVQQARLLQTLDFIWQSQSLYRKNSYGQEKKLAYLQEKVKKIEYLDGVFLPGICFSLAHYYGDARNVEMAIKWFKLAANAQDYGDVIGIKGTELHLRALAVKKEAHDAWQSLLAYSASNPQKQEKSGCFIATAAYASPLAAEVTTFRQIRDEVLLRSRLGRCFVRLYYFVSPPLAAQIAKHQPLQTATRRFLLEPILRIVKKRRY